jgi:hypothetical protein
MSIAVIVVQNWIGVEMNGIEVSVETETCFACLTKSEAVFMICLPLLVVTLWFLIDWWVKR